MIDLVPLTDGQAEQFARIEQLWPEFGHSLQVLAASEGGGMGWRTVDGVEYLTRYTQENGKKKGRSLGRRSPETEAIMEQFDSTVLKARRIRREYREDVLLTCKLAKAHGIARLHGRFAHTLDWLWYTDANRRVALFCQSALEWDPLSASKRDPFLVFTKKARDRPFVGRQNAMFYAIQVRDFYGRVPVMINSLCRCELVAVGSIS